MKKNELKKAALLGIATGLVALTGQVDAAVSLERDTNVARQGCKGGCGAKNDTAWNNNYYNQYPQYQDYQHGQAYQHSCGGGYQPRGWQQQPNQGWQQRGYTADAYGSSSYDSSTPNANPNLNKTTFDDQDLNPITPKPQGTGDFRDPNFRNQNPNQNPNLNPSQNPNQIPSGNNGIQNQQSTNYKSSWNR